MVAIDPSLTFWCLIPYPFMLMTLFGIIRALFVQTKEVQAQLSGLSTKVQENLSGMTLIKTFNLQDAERVGASCCASSSFEDSSTGNPPLMTSWRSTPTGCAWRGEKAAHHFIGQELCCHDRIFPPSAIQLGGNHNVCKWLLLLSP